MDRRTFTVASRGLPAKPSSAAIVPTRRAKAHTVFATADREGLPRRFIGALELYGEIPYIALEEMFVMTAIAKRRKTDRERKTERLELRVAPSAKRVIQRAMAVSGLAAGDLAYEGARRVLEDHQRMVLIGEDREAFLRALLNPPEPSPRLIKALQRHRELFG